MQYRRLEKDEIIKEGDQVDQCANPWKDKPKWEDCVGNLGEPAPDPAFPSHRQYRRPIYPSGYHVTLEAMRASNVDQPGVVSDIRNCFLREIDVPPGQAAAVIDFLLEQNEQLCNSVYGLQSALNSTERQS